MWTLSQDRGICSAYELQQLHVHPTTSKAKESNWGTWWALRDSLQFGKDLGQRRDKPEESCVVFQRQGDGRPLLLCTIDSHIGGVDTSICTSQYSWSPISMMITKGSHVTMYVENHWKLLEICAKT